jgi:hypothetical protein
MVAERSPGCVEHHMSMLADVALLLLLVLPALVLTFRYLPGKNAALGAWTLTGRKRRAARRPRSES